MACGTVAARQSDERWLPCGWIKSNKGKRLCLDYAYAVLCTSKLHSDWGFFPSLPLSLMLPPSPSYTPPRSHAHSAALDVKQKTVEAHAKVPQKRKCKWAFSKWILNCSQRRQRRGRDGEKRWGRGGRSRVQWRCQGQRPRQRLSSRGCWARIYICMCHIYKGFQRERMREREREREGEPEHESLNERIKM